MRTAARKRLASMADCLHSEDNMTFMSKMLSAALLAGFVVVAQPAVSLACDGEGHAKKEEKNKQDTVAQREQTETKKKNEQAPSDKKDREAQGSSGTRTN
jgi:hypothetical protein